MVRLTEKDEHGNWCVKGLPWDTLHEGQMITEEVRQKLYGCLCKLMKYEDTGMSPEEIEDSKKTFEHMRWIPVEERLPDPDDNILMSFENFNIPLVGHYEEDGDGGAFYVGDDLESCASAGLFVNAWIPLPKPHRPEGE